MIWQSYGLSGPFLSFLFMPSWQVEEKHGWHEIPLQVKHLVMIVEMSAVYPALMACRATEKNASSKNVRSLYSVKRQHHNVFASIILFIFIKQENQHGTTISQFKHCVRLRHTRK